MNFNCSMRIIFRFRVVKNTKAILVMLIQGGEPNASAGGMIAIKLKKGVR